MKMFIFFRNLLKTGTEIGKNVINNNLGVRQEWFEFYKKIGYALKLKKS